MKKHTVLSFLVLIIAAAIGTFLFMNRPKPDGMQFTQLDALFVKNDVPLAEDDFNYFIIDNQEELDSVFGVARTMSNKNPEIDFNKDTVIAIVKSPVNKKDEIKVNSIKIIDRNLYVDFDYNKGEDLTYVMTPATIISVAKAYVLDLYFIHGAKTIKKIALGRRNLESPKSAADLLQNYTGTFAGSFPCADCSGIETTLNLKADGTYELAQTYLGKTAEPIKESGNWTPSEDLTIVELMSSGTFYYIDNADVIELMSPDQKRISTDMDYRLTRQ